MTTLNDIPPNNSKYSQADQSKSIHGSHEEMLNVAAELKLQAIELSYCESEPLFRRILEIKEFVYGLEHSEVAAAINSLAANLLLLDRYDEAEELSLRSLSIQEKVYGSEHEELAITLYLLALMYSKMERYTDAESLFLRVLAIREKINGPVHEEVSNALCLLANEYRTMERYTDAVPLYQRALAIREQIHGLEHAEVSDTLNILALTYRIMNRNTDAVPLYQRALSINEKIYGLEHAEVASTLSNLADTFNSMERFTDAVPLCQRVLATREKILGLEHEEVADTLSDLADSYFNIGQLTDAVPLYQRALAIRENALGPEHQDLYYILKYLGLTFLLLEQFTDAEPHFQRALGITEKMYEQEHENALFNMAFTYFCMSRYEDALPLYQRLLAIQEKIYGSFHEEVAFTLANLARTCFGMELFADAVPLYQRALTIREKIDDPEHINVAEILTGLAGIYAIMGQFTDALPLYQRALAIQERILGSEHKVVALTLADFAGAYWDAGYLSKAEHLFKRANKISEVSSANADEILKISLWTKWKTKLSKERTDLNDQEIRRSVKRAEVVREWKIGDIAFDDSFGLMLKGDYAGALKLSQGALDKSINVEEKLSAATTLKVMGMTTQAESILKQLVTVSDTKQGSNDCSIIVYLNELAELYTSTERYAEAEAHLHRSLLLCEQETLTSGLGDLKGKTLCALAGLYAESGRHDDAIKQIMLAIDCTEKLFGEDSTHTAKTLGVAADIFTKTGRYPEAESHIQRCLEIEKINFSSRHPNVLLSQMKLAEIYHKMYRELEAESLYQDALSQVRETFGPDHPGLAEYLIIIAEFYKETYRLPAAAMLGKLAVNIIQKTRHSLSSLDKETRKSFDDKYRPMYTKLADILVESERYPEAEQVLAMLKEEQSFAFVRRDSGLSSSLSTISFTPVETELLNLFSAVYSKEDKSHLAAEEPCALGGDDSSQNRSVTETDAELQRFFDSLVVELGAAPASKVDRESDLQADLWDLPTGTVAIYAFAAEHNFRLILNTPEGRHASSCPINCNEFNRLIFDFRQALQQPVDNIDLVKELGKKLYDIILAPVETELLANKTHTILWMVEGLLQCMPFAALHDGSRFIVERFANVLLTPRSKSRMHDSVQPHWNALGMATTRGDELHSPLGFALGEISAIIRDDGSTNGVLSGTKLLDEKFTWGNVKGALRGGSRFQAIHIATHFHLNPVNDSQCYLLLGDGQKLSLESFRKDPDVRFNGVDIVALSACSTALNLALNNGREIDGIAGIAESKGAKSVLATLWPVEDESTSFVMQTFYRLRETGLTKGEAIRMAQMALLSSEHDLHSGHDYAHPFFWAPFILIGNWK